MSTRRPRILVAGLGNPLMGDDGVGVHVCRALAAQVPRPHHYVVAQVGTAIYSSLHLLEWADAILAVDAMCAGGEPGSLYLAEPDQIADHSTQISLHDLGLLGALQILRDRRRREVIIIGVEPQTVGVSTELSSPVASAVPAVVDRAKTLVAAWLRETHPGEG